MSGGFFGIIFLFLLLWWIWYNHKKKTERHLDPRGYYRDGYGKLVHRNIAYKHHYKYPYKHSQRFRDYDIHHIDRNKLNNHPDNLQILTRKQHMAEHGYF